MKTISQASSIQALLKVIDDTGDGSLTVGLAREILSLPTCDTCTPPVVSLSVFKELTWLSDPQFQNDSKDYYKAFADVYGQDTKEVGRPGSDKAKDK